MTQQLNLPVFSGIAIDQIEAGLDTLLADARATIAKLETLDQPGWQNFAMPLQQIDRAIDDYFSPVSHLNGVKNSDELRDVYQRCIAKLTEYGSEFGQNTAMCAQYKKLAASGEYPAYSAAQQQWVQQMLRDFRLAGVDLPAQEKARYKEIQARLAQLTQQFSNNVLDATAAWTKHVADAAELAGLPQAVLSMLQQKAEQKSQSGWLLTLDFPVYQAVITYAENRALREEMYLAYMTKASDQGPQAGQFDNSAAMVEILQLRQEAAKLLGFANYAERSLFPKMAESVQQVCDFLLNLAEKSYPFAEREKAELERYGKTLGIDVLQAWDVAFVSEKYRQQYYALSQETLREYFPLPTVIRGMFTIIERIYQVSIEQQESFDSYHPDVQFYRIYKEGTLLAGFYLDAFAREHKRGGAWMADCRVRWLKPDGTEEIPVAYLTCNFRAAENDKPALLSHDEVLTLFHEFGHGLHHMLTTENVAGVSGISGVEWDAVELPSQFMENWCWQKEGIALISAHYQSGEPLPEAMLDNMLKARNFNSGMMMLRQLEFALFDLLLHSVTHIDEAGQVQEILAQVRDRVAVILPPEQVRFQHAFTHIFAGGYAAGYYSYKWAEVLSADAFSLFEENGIFDAVTGQRFLQEVLQKGSSRPAAESFRAFRGREPDINALLKHSGLL